MGEIFMNEKASLTDEQMNERSLRSIKNHQRGLKVLTGAALGLWLVAMVGSVFVIWAYFEEFEPKAKYISQSFEQEMMAARTNTVATSSSGESEKDRAGKNHTMFMMTRAVGIGMLYTAKCVAVLSAAMLATIILVIWNRRVTLRQINANLTQISAQLKRMEGRRDKG
jgi:hypothetical protein